jgi:hypothetical protein
MINQCLDGSRVRISIPGVEMPAPFTSEGMAVLPTGEQSFCAGLREHGLVVAQEPDFGVVTFVEDYAYQNGRLRIGWSELPRGVDGAEYREFGPGRERGPGNLVSYPTLRWFALWEGSRYSLHLHTLGHRRAGTLLQALHHFVIAETELGIVLLRRGGGSGDYTQGPGLARSVPGLGLVDAVELTSKTARRLPRWEGTRVRGGQLWVAKRHEHERYFVLAGHGSVARVHPDPREDQATVMARLSELSVSWTPVP